LSGDEILSSTVLLYLRDLILSNLSSTASSLGVTELPVVAVGGKGIRIDFALGTSHSSSFDILPCLEAPDGLFFIPAGRRAKDRWSLCYTFKYNRERIDDVAVHWSEVRTAMRLVEHFIQSEKLPQSLSSTAVCTSFIRSIERNPSYFHSVSFSHGLAFVLSDLLQTLLSPHPSIAHLYGDLLAELTTADVPFIVKRFCHRFISCIQTELHPSGGGSGGGQSTTGKKSALVALAGGAFWWWFGTFQLVYWLVGSYPALPCLLSSACRRSPFLY
jgi:hypothetical protein